MKQNSRMRRFVSAINPSARSARGRYGADGEAVVRLLRALARLDVTDWDALVAANDTAGRRRPPDSDASNLHQVDYMTAAGNDATAVAIAAAGPEAVEAWRRDLARIGHEQRGEGGTAPSEAQTTLAERAWGYQYVAQHMAFLIVSAHRRGGAAVRREWEPYEAVVRLAAILGA
jgi:hypothetical protein